MYNYDTIYDRERAKAFESGYTQIVKTQAGDGSDCYEAIPMATAKNPSKMTA